MSEIKLIEIGTEQKIIVKGYETPLNPQNAKGYIISKYYYEKLMDIILSGALIRSIGNPVVLRYKDETLFFEVLENEA